MSLVRRDTLSDNWQVFLYGVRQEKTGYYAGLAIFDKGINREVVELIDPTTSDKFLLQIPSQFCNSPDPIVKIECQIQIKMQT